MLRIDTSAMDFDALLRREWLETNGLGGYASCSVAGVNTRRYSGLLVAALAPPVGRYVLLSKLEESMRLDGETHELGCNCYPDAVHPEGFSFIAGFQKNPFPETTFAVSRIVMVKTIFMPHGEDTVIVEWKVTGWGGHSDVALAVRPLIAFRDFHALTHENPDIDGRTEQRAPGMLAVTPYAHLPALCLSHNADTFENTGHWYRNFEYAAERQRGLDFQEDLFNPHVLRFALTPAKPTATIVVSLGGRTVQDAPALREMELERRSRLTLGAGSEQEALLRLAADQFIVNRGAHKTVIAGYHWFSDWGRDTMISLPGLAIATGRLDDARDILTTFAGSMDMGMLPNRFPDAGGVPEYNTVDATLWFFQAAREFWRASRDDAFVREQLFPVLKESVDWHVRGTRHAIHMDQDGLLFSGEPGVQLTWMDAKIGDWVVTPRQGKPVEIEALWYNALLTVSEMSAAFSPGEPDKFRPLAERARASFKQQFWNAEQNCLYDVVNGDEKDGAIRPNQLLAISLPGMLLEQTQAQQVLEVVQRLLLTPYGLRTLSPNDPNYRPSYSGDGRSRDSSYHQGTVWPWPLGPFISAYLRINQDPGSEARKQARQWLDPLLDFLSDPGLGQIPEIFDGSAPQRPAGCIAQAWSVGELLRVYRLVSKDDG